MRNFDLENGIITGASGPVGCPVGWEPEPQKKTYYVSLDATVYANVEVEATSASEAQEKAYALLISEPQKAELDFDRVKIVDTEVE